jgi:endonuclease/exonuclease/phosphatase family metal-dependent hydrolase
MNRGRQITLASLNLHGGLTSHGEPFDVAAACGSLKADVITLQEAWRPDEPPDVLNEIAAALGAEVRYRGLGRPTNRARLGLGTDEGLGTWGLAVLTSLPVAAYQEIELGRAPGDRSSRAAQVLTLTTPEGGTLVGSGRS